MVKVNFVSVSKTFGKTEVVREINLDVAEPLGSETSLHVDIKKTRLVARSEGRKAIKAGERIKLVADMNHLHIFDEKTAQTLA